MPITSQALIIDMDNRHACRLSMSIPYVELGQIEAHALLLTTSDKQALSNQILEIAQSHAIGGTGSYAILGSGDTAVFPNDLHADNLAWVQLALILDRLPIAKGD